MTVSLHELGPPKERGAMDKVVTRPEEQAVWFPRMRLALK